MVDAVAHNHIKPPWLTKERFVLRAPAPIAVAGGVVLGIRLGFNHHTPKQAAVLLAFHQQATNQVGGDQFGRAGEEGLGEVLGSRGRTWWLLVEMIVFLVGSELSLPETGSNHDSEDES